ncbi:MAG: hypothetical protein ABIF77_02405 [bacterium]
MSPDQQSPSSARSVLGTAVPCICLLVLLLPAPCSHAAVEFVDSGQSPGDGRTIESAVGDPDGDDDPDVCTTHADQGNTAWINDGAGGFSSAGVLLRNGYSITLVDVDNDRDLDALVGTHEGTGGNRLYLNETEVATEAASWGRLKALAR